MAELAKQSHYLKRIKCDGPGCRAVTDWEFLPEGIYPIPDGWVFTKDVQLCPACFKSKNIKNKDKMYDLYQRVLEYRRIE
jgi:hypothetical protein